MKIPRVRFTIRRMMVVVLLASLVLAFLARERRLAVASAQAQAAYLNASLARKVAEIAVVEYREGIAAQDRETVRGEIALAEADRSRAEDRVEWSRKMHARGFVTQAQATSDKLSLDRALFSVEQARTKRDVLEKYTFDKTVKELESEVEKAQSEELARQADYARAQRRWPW